MWTRSREEARLPPHRAARKGRSLASSRALPALGVLAFGLAFASAQTDTGGLGKISFPTSGGAEAQRRCLRGVAAVHNFAYEEAILEFREAQRIDKGFAMAYWGEAMANNQTLWLNLDLEDPAVTETGAPRLKAIQSVMRAEYVIETRSFEMLRTHADFATSAELFAIGLSAAETGLPQVAALARNELRKRSQNQKLDAAIMEKELAAVLELREGRGARAVELMKEAVALEKSLPPPLGPPRPVKPSYELEGEILIELGRHKDAASAFEQSLARWPNRTASLLGLARALAASGDRDAPQKHYRQLLSNWSHADAAVNELDEATRAVAGAR